MKKNIYIDNAASKYQQYGGITRLWNEYKNFGDDLNAHDDGVFRVREFDVSYGKTGFIGKVISIFGRCVGVFVSQECSIFHTSYYFRPLFFKGYYAVTVFDFIYEKRKDVSLKSAIAKHLKYRSILSADVIICISEMTKVMLCDAFPGIRREKIHTVLLGYDQDMFFPNKDMYSGFMSKTIVFVGFRRPHKRFDLLIDVLQDVDEFNLIIAGEEVDEKLRQELDIKLQDRWKYVGVLSDDKLANIYRNSFALFFPSDSEGFGLPVLEAMASGLPVIASNLPVFKEFAGESLVYADKQTQGSYVKALLSLLDPDVYEFHRNAAIECSKHRTWKNTIQAYVDIFEKIK